MNSLTKKQATLITLLVGFGCANTTMADYVGIFPPNGKQCSVSGINNSGLVVGNCSTGNITIPNSPWVALTPATPALLPRLAPAQPCSVGSISNAGWIVGECGGPDGANSAVVWDANDLAAGILKLLPRPGLIGLFPDVSTVPSAINQRGGVLGSSINRSGVSTVVLWGAGQSNARDVSSPGDNCIGVDLTYTLVNGRPVAATNCPDVNGTMTGKVAQHNGLLYISTPLPKPAGALTCVATSINDALQVVGGCKYPTAPFSRAAFWATPTSTPTLVPTLSGNSVSIASLLNNSAQAVVDYSDADGNASTAVWNVTAGTVNLVPTFTIGVGSSGVALADNGTLLVRGANSGSFTESATWDTSNGLQSFGFYSGGKNSMVGVISQDGSKIAGTAENSAQVYTAVVIQ
ncbi:hypothetical protein [Pseudomonas shahriarae]|uniref:Uncharacterized protein n=1 Tax=Pseudomonas shahriarae TaxID=2745512 RepID=A0ABT5NEN4_9PSED|nr:hypothetical protein [Pseudomonas shahriarae]MDD0986987.1 hypothetical protein [Pseudomonas shahriarae]MDD1032397.1 hypothetical protein [Pseudomonas shahriarae]